MKSFRKSLPVAPIALVMRALMTLSLAMLIATAASAQTPSNAGANSSQPQITFAKDVVPILQAKCQDCHHAGGMAPMSLVTYNETRPWAAAMKPATTGGRRIMHHVLARLQQDEPDSRKTLFTGVDANSEGPGMLMEWAIGKNYDIYRPNTGKLLLPGAHIWWELHLHSVGEEVTSHAQLAIYLYPKGQEPKYRTYLMSYTANPRVNGQLLLDIPPNTVKETDGFHVLKSPAILENFQPHMHLRGKAMAMEAILPDGSTQMLSYVDHFNFNWMTNYIYTDDAAPVLPAGTVLHITAWHDNTVNNPNNPDPNQWVGWGERTVDEMSHAWVNVTFITDEDYQSYVAKQKSQVASAAPSR